MTCGIYRLTFPSGSTYIGSSSQIERRIKYHLGYARRGKHRNPKINASLAKTPGEILAQTLIICREEDLLLYEQICIDLYKPNLNIVEFAGRPAHCPEVRRKIGLGNTGKVRSPEHRAAVSAAQLGRRGQVFTDERRKKISEALMGNKNSLNSAKLSASLKEHYKKNPKVVSEETKAKMRASSLGKKMSDEAKAKLSIALKGRKPTEETRAKLRARRASEETKSKLRSAIAKRKEQGGFGPLSAKARENMRIAHLGKKPSAETKEKMSEAMKASWARRKAKSL